MDTSTNRGENGHTNSGCVRALLPIDLSEIMLRPRLLLLFRALHLAPCRNRSDRLLLFSDLA